MNTNNFGGGSKEKPRKIFSHIRLIHPSTYNNYCEVVLETRSVASRKINEKDRKIISLTTPPNLPAQNRKEENAGKF